MRKFLILMVMDAPRMERVTNGRRTVAAEDGGIDPLKKRMGKVDATTRRENIKMYSGNKDDGGV